MLNLEVHDRVIRHGWPSRQEANRYGTIIEVYRGAPSGVAKGPVFYAVQWDDGTIERGYLAMSHSLIKYITVPTMVTLPHP